MSKNFQDKDIAFSVPLTKIQEFKIKKILNEQEGFLLRIGVEQSVSPVQGQVCQACGQYQRRSLYLSGTDGGRYPALSGGCGSGGYRSDAASGDYPRYCPAF